LILLSINTTEVTYTHRETRGIDSTAFMSIDLSEFGRGFLLWHTRWFIYTFVWSTFWS